MHMKQKVSILWLPIQLSLFFWLISIPQLLSAQENNDSIHIINNDVLTEPESTFQLSPLDLLPAKSTAYPSYSPEHLNKLPNFSLKGEIYMPYQTNPSKLFQGDYCTSGVLKQFNHGALFGSGGQTSIPGIGRLNNASFGYQHIFNQKLMLQLNASAMKINMPHFAGQTFSASGTLLYHPSDRVTFKLFGSYDLGNSYGMSTHYYGASMSVDMSERFGVEMGVQRYYDSMRGRWETVPMVIPYYRFDKFTLGVDVGGIVYEILRELVFDKRNNEGPTIAPPRFPIPIR